MPDLPESGIIYSTITLRKKATQPLTHPGFDVFLQQGCDHVQIFVLNGNGDGGISGSGGTGSSGALGGSGGGNGNGDGGTGGNAGTIAAVALGSRIPRVKSFSRRFLLPTRWLF